MSGPGQVSLVPHVNGDGEVILSGGAGFVGGGQGGYEAVGMSPENAYGRAWRDWHDDRVAEQERSERLAVAAADREAAAMLGLVRGRTNREVLADAVAGMDRSDIHEAAIARRAARLAGLPGPEAEYVDRRRTALHAAAERQAAEETAPATVADVRGLKGELAALGSRLRRLGGR